MNEKKEVWRKELKTERQKKRNKEKMEEGIRKLKQDNKNKRNK